VCTMKMPADSLLLASADLAAIGVAYLALWTSMWGPVLFLFVVLVLSPVLLVLAVAHGVVDLSRRRTRLQAIVALLLTAPCWLLVCLLYRDFP
jgi:fatty acid desaturase